MPKYAGACATFTALLLFTFIVGCGRPQPVKPSQEQIVDRVRSEVAKLLEKDASQIDVNRPLSALGADELDVVEIVMAAEEAFDVAIPDDAIADKPGDVSKTLTVQKLAEIVAKQTKSK